MAATSFLVTGCAAQPVASVPETAASELVEVAIDAALSHDARRLCSVTIPGPIGCPDTFTVAELRRSLPEGTTASVLCLLSEPPVATALIETRFPDGDASVGLITIVATSAGSQRIDSVDFWHQRAWGGVVGPDEPLTVGEGSGSGECPGGDVVEPVPGKRFTLVTRP